ncbi:MAG TPA: hypothetical protein VFU55_07100 [Terracidiphilus sp.]|nr:hypothetical protein [Terracidiphilus sp.]
MAEETVEETNASAPAGRRIPPAWLMGMTYATFGLVGGFTAVTIPQILDAQHVPVGRIASITAVVMSSGFWGLAIAPLVDIRYRRRTYALVCGVLAALAGSRQAVLHSFTVSQPQKCV